MRGSGLVVEVVEVVEVVDVDRVDADQSGLTVREPLCRVSGQERRLIAQASVPQCRSPPV